MLDAYVHHLPTDLLRVIYTLYTEIHLQEHLQACRRLFLEFRALEERFQEETTRYEQYLHYHFRTILSSGTPWNVRDEMSSLKEIFRTIGGHRDRPYRQLLIQYKKYGRSLNYYVNELAYDVCEQLWLSLYTLNRTPDGRRTLLLHEVKKAQSIFKKEIHLVYLGLQTLPRYEQVKLELLQYILRRIEQYLNSWTFYIRRWLYDPPAVWVQLCQLLHEKPVAVQRFLTISLPNRI